MKKTISIIAIALCLVLCIPSVPCYAFDTSNLYARTKASVSGFWDDPTQDHIQQCVTSLDSSNVNAIAAKVANLSSYGGAGNTFSKQYYAVFYWSDAGYIMVYSFDDASGYPFIFCPTNITDNVNAVSYRIVKNDSTDMNAYAIGLNDSSFSEFAGSVSNENGVYVRDWNNGALLCTNIPVFVYNDTQTTTLIAIRSLYDTYTNYFPENLPYLNQEGEIVDPAPVVEYESNSNHMYFQNCDLGFCEPTDIKNFTSFGGAYLYCKYTLDNWVINHINEYELQFNVVSAIGSEQNNFTYSMRVDRNGFVTIPFSYLFQSNSPSAIPINRGFAAVVTNQKLGTDYNIAHLYSVANSNVPNFIRTLGAEYNYNLTDLGWSALKGGTLKYLCAWVSDGGTISMNNLAEWSENVAQSFNPYILRVNVKLVSGDDSSGDYAEKFDLYAGDQSTVDTGGLVNNDPFVPDVDQDDGDLPSIPEDPNSTTPSTIVYTGGTFTGNFNGVIGFDPGYRDLKADLDADPDDNFTQYLAPFENNEVGGFVGDFLDDMPTAMKSIFIGGFGVLTLLGIYRFIRRG